MQATKHRTRRKPIVAALCCLPVLTAWAIRHQTVRARRSYHRLSRTDRERLSARLLTLVNHGAIEKGQARYGPARMPAQVLAIELDLSPRMLDEALRQLIRDGLIGGVLPYRTRQWVVHVETTPRGLAIDEQRAARAAAAKAAEPPRRGSRTAPVPVDQAEERVH